MWRAQHKEEVKKKKKKHEILPTNMPQEQFHNLICMGLF